MRVFRKTENKPERKDRAARGYTLMEMLVVIAIIVVLIGIVAIAASSIISSMKQNKLDTIAQDIYVAAQDRLTEMYTDNRADEVDIEKRTAKGDSTAGMYLLKAEDTTVKPKDWDNTNTYAGLNAMNNTEAAAASVLLPAGSLSAEVEANHWIIEYNPEYGYVYGVYYSEKGFTPAQIDTWYTSGTANKYRVFADRKGSGVGYYGGTGVLGGKVVMTNTALNVSVNIINAEELKADISVKIPTQFKDRLLRLTMTFTGERSGTVTKKEVVLDAMNYGYFNRTYPITMDSFNMKSGKSQQFGQQELFQGMHPGENVTVEVFAELGEQGSGTFAPDAALDTARTTAVFNSLFHSVDTETSTAYVSAGRHLQNLNNLSASGIQSVEITNVVQVGNIDFKNTTDDVVDDTAFWWAETYPGRTFEPINNNRIVSMLGSGKDEENNTVYYIISGMTVDLDADGAPAGMFGTLGKTAGSVTVTDVSLVGSKVTGTGAVGALAGEAKGRLTMVNTGAYLTRDDYNNKNYSTAGVALRGDTVGGLVGVVESNVTATECYAAEILRGGSYAGGLFGSVGGTMELSRSYADCYLTAVGGSVGGLAGACGSASTISSCYSAGFAIGMSENSAGFVPNAVASVRNSYTVLNIGPNSTENTQVTTKFFTTVASCSNLANVYYAPQEGVAYDEGKIVKIGEEKSFSLLRNGKVGTYTNLADSGSFRFSSVSGDTTAYNLAAGLGLTNYPYPFIYREDGRTVLHHYGDWDGNLFDPGTLVYFEEYSNGYRGYYGAGSNYLNSAETVVRDGYALLYTANSVESAPYFGNVEADVTYNSKVYQIPAIQGQTGKYTVIKRSITGNPVEASYYFRDLPADIVNSEAAATAQFYTYIKVETPDTKDEENKGVSHYYFNPHFAATVEQVENESSLRPTLSGAAKNVVRIRTPRHLYLLSQYFDKGYSSALTAKVTLEQEMKLDYTDYRWKEAGYEEAVSVQAPIGHGGSRFNATYDGRSYAITGVSFRSDNLYTGMFGCVGSDGRLRNIILGAQKEEERYAGFTTAPQQANNYAYAGTLVGYNGGTITNCAVAGYTLSLDTYNTTLYVGGLVGYNNKSISGCSVENPLIAVRTNRANAFVGSFAGFNSGSGIITNTCSMSSLDVSRYTSGTVRVGGFVGSNAGSVSSSYTACAMTASNISEKDIDGFTLAGGSVQSCYFLTGGTYKFAGKVYAYGQESQTANKAVGASGLPGGGSVALKGFGTVSDESYCYFNDETRKSTSEMAAVYPFASPVKLIGGGYVFCGDWITDDIFGNYGMLYWEHEVGGTNEGYHFYLVDEDNMTFNTLCTSHDDGGVITEYGYGYYRLGTLPESKPQFNNVSVLETYRNEAAEQDLSGQFSDSYAFVLYNTSDAFQDSPNGLYVTGSNAYATATYEGKTYSFSPFFGAALQMGQDAPTEMQVRSIHQLQFLNWNQGGTQTVTNETYEEVSGLTYGGIWGYNYGNGTIATSYYYKSGEDYYQVYITRSGDWENRTYTLTANNQTIGEKQQPGTKTVTVTLYQKSTTTSIVSLGGNTKQLVDETNYRLFTYLGQTNHAREEKATQGKKEAYNSTVFGWKWEQTHDIKLDASVVTGFTPIAAAATSSTSNYDATLYAWFGSTYDGNSYKIEDVNITSGAFTVGLFGVTAGAKMKNIIMYSENNATICRSTSASDKAGAYSLGGMIGVAYDYDGVSNDAIENCAIAGYRIVDNSRNQQTLGEANVGGLVGVCNGNMTRCSAVTDIIINCTHKNSANQFTQAKYGNFLRVGGLTGATLGIVKDNNGNIVKQGIITDCYTGGSISVGSETLAENRNVKGDLVVKGERQNKQVVVSGDPSSTSIYIAGIGGSGFAQNYKNFSGQDGLREGNPKFVNCYTYVNFPNLEGTIRGISIIGSVADRYANGATLSIENCYYLDAIIDEIEMLSVLQEDSQSASTRFFYYDHNDVKKVYSSLTANDSYYFKEMLKGTGRCEFWLFKHDNEHYCCDDPDLTALSLQGLSELGLWSRVTTTENGATINGKYSFPAGDHQLDGRNYPFPAIVSQTSDATGKPVRVHYGRWPKGNGLYSSVSNITLDLLVQDADSMDVKLTNYASYAATEITSLDELTLRYSELQEDGTVRDDLETSEIVSVTPELRSDGTVKLTILGLKEGTVTITARYGGNEAKIQVTVTAEFSISAVPVTVTVDENGEVTQVTEAADPTLIPEAFQQDDLYWKLSGVNSEGTPIELTAENPENWRVEDNTVDENFDEYQFLTAKTGEVLLRFRSNEVKLHNVQVTAYNVPGVSAQQVTGTRSREITFEIIRNPPTVYVFAYPQGSAQNTPLYTLYQLRKKDAEVWYAFDKAGTTDPATKLADPEKAPAGYADFLGYFLADNAEGESEAFTKAEDGTICYFEPIENESNSLMVFGMWKPATYTASFKTGYDTVKIDGLELDSASGNYQMVYTTVDPLTIPTVNPDEFKDEKLNRTAVFSGWKVSSTDSDSSWTVDGKFSAGTKLDPGLYGDVTFEAVWSSRYEIHYFGEDGTEYEVTDKNLTTYVGEAAEIRLFTPDVPAQSDLMFIGWKLLQTEQPAGVTGWTPGVLYNDPVTGISCTGNVDLQAQWGRSYSITFMNGSKVFLEDKYAEGTVYQFPEGPEPAAGYRFAGWKVEPVSDTAGGWTEGTSYKAGETLDNTVGGYTGAVTLSAQWEKASYAITFDLAGGTTSDGKTEIEPITYEFGSGTVILPKAPAKEECTFSGWMVTGTDEDSSWTLGEKFDPEQVLTIGNEIYGNVTLTAHWEEVTYTVYYDPNGGNMNLEPVNDQFVTRYTKSSGVVLAEAMRNGYTLEGWKQSSDPAENTFFGTQVWEAGKLITGATQDVHMVAQWKLDVYTITYVDQDGNQLFTGENHTYSITSESTLKSLESIPGYSVEGWRVIECDSNGWTKGERYSAETSVKGHYGNVTLQCTKTVVSGDLKYYIQVTEDSTRAPYDEGKRDIKYTIEQDVKLEAAPPDTSLNNKAYFFTSWKAEVGSDTGGWENGKTYGAEETLTAGTYYGPVNLVSKYETRTLTLYARKANDAQKEFTVVANYDNTSFSGYFGENCLTPVRDGWELDGWCTKDNASGTKVLNADGSIASGAENVPGYTFDGKFALTQNQTLYARWKKTVKAFTQVNSLTKNQQYVIGKVLDDGLHVLMATGSNGNYSIGTETITNVDDGTYWVEELPSTGSIQWQVQIQNGSYYFEIPNTSNYLSHFNASLSINDQWFISWSVDEENNRIFYTTTIPIFGSFTYYLTINDTGPTLVEDTPCNLEFFQVTDREVMDYDES